jgi:hypothetical protein
VAVVVDPIQSVKGKVVIDAFRRARARPVTLSVSSRRLLLFLAVAWALWLPGTSAGDRVGALLYKLACYMNASARVWGWPIGPFHAVS